ncbi:methyl-accepting chemotaxis protein [Bacillus cereus]|uniref:Methyl-accepting chemotaxis protein n=2 Tax=Bacillus cereus TaxID=1396 RepID=A0A9X6VRM1_BACCE|nr:MULTISPECIES: methyl-accepting chemotaxis protein [Bacillus cereus group]AHZ54696.1 Methyl-accepting chemotaxis protein [Bacillus thuringiensis serovar kurstaki str. YBT-1520]AIE37757.1 Methyl-accepting chemotaxis protein [Bacillus thuringiensis serovar kurstaki str. HD-1]AIM34878.1 methyl-accepting chemotaxis protein [Bacillus thuringiensis serovar kurstaki str. YBT-1520]AJK37740.1 methyl-accepting chemotaxis (MCP) signaling domain protein [Bacillus thuringiensis serovar kurstaki]AKJ62623.
MKKYWHKLSLLQKNVLLTVLVILTLVGSMGALSFNMFQNSMMSIFERQSFETGDAVLNQLDLEIVRDVAKDPTAQRVKKEKLTEQLNKSIKDMKSVGQTYVTGAKLNEKAELQIVALDTELANTVSVKPGEYYEQPTYWMKTYDKVIQTKQAQMTEVYEDELGFWVTILEPVTDENKNIIAIVAADLEASIIPLTKKNFMIQGLLFIIISLTIAITIQIFISRNSLSPLKDLQEGLRKVGEGDLSIKLNERSDDIGITNIYFNNTIKKFNKIIDKVRETAEQVSTSSQELSVSTKENSIAFKEIASAITGLNLGAHSHEYVVQKCLGIVQEMESKMKEIKGAAKQVGNALEDMEQHSVEGKDLIKQIVNQMKRIQDTVQDVSSSIYAFEARSKEIHEILTVITTISNQTNSLALNASTESSCAGEMGEEFSGVADEVHILAERTEASARDIAKLIGETQAEAERAVRSIQKSSKEVEVGITLVQSSGAFFEKISESAQSVTNQIKATSNHSSEILTDNQTIVQFINELSHIANTYVNSSSNVETSMKEQELYVQDIAELANSLNWLSQELQGLIGEFKSK